MLRIFDRQSRFFGFAVVETYVPYYPDRYMHIDMARKLIFINKCAREDANVVTLIFE